MASIMSIMAGSPRIADAETALEHGGRSLAGLEDHVDGLTHEVVFKKVDAVFGIFRLGLLDRLIVMGPVLALDEFDHLVDFRIGNKGTLDAERFGRPEGIKEHIPLPISLSAPDMSKMVREST